MNIALIMDRKGQKLAGTTIRERLDGCFLKGDVRLDVVDYRCGYMHLEGCSYDLVIILGCADMLDEQWWSCIKALHKEWIVL